MHSAPAATQSLEVLSANGQPTSEHESSLKSSLLQLDRTLNDLQGIRRSSKKLQQGLLVTCPMQWFTQALCLLWCVVFLALPRTMSAYHGFSQVIAVGLSFLMSLLLLAMLFFKTEGSLTAFQMDIQESMWKAADVMIQVSAIEETNQIRSAIA